ncbi:hypothetical protein ACH429_04680 [Streptomyces pathocidini]|uniref:Uncharacterized protein n=1 Tax=Streptomyces pathocidini TaxID=1650571 RepID=A0ABW7UL83_9ACTN|nr:hypothetical protein [Streptomyces pathocidini]
MTAVGPPGGYGGARPPSVANHLSGHAGGPVVQAGRIHGGIAYNYHLPPPVPDDVPDQVPAVRRFTNRTKDLSALDSWLARYAADAPGIGVLSGLPGVGKTAMACRWAGLARERFPDGQIYVDFASLRDRAGSDVSEAVGMCLRALGVSDQYLPGSLAERVGWYRTRSAGRRMLLVLDDVTEPAQVTAPVPKGRGSAVLVTSHRDLSELALDQAEFLRLEPLDRDSAPASRPAAEQGADGEVWPLAEAFTVLFLHHRHLGDWKESLELGAAAAARAGEPAAEARLLSLLSRLLLDLGEDDRAREELQTAVARADASGHPVLRASVREFLGRYWDRADPARAIAVHREALDLNTAAGERRGAAIAAYFLGAAQDAAGDHTTALATLRGARGELLELGDARMAARAAAAIGLAHGHLDEPSAARDELREAVRVLREQDAHHYEAQALVVLADLAPRTGEGPATVREYLARAVEIHEEGGSPAAEALRERLNRLEETPD